MRLVGLLRPLAGRKPSTALSLDGGDGQRFGMSKMFVGDIFAFSSR